MTETSYIFNCEFDKWETCIERINFALKVAHEFSEDDLVGFIIGIRINGKFEGHIWLNWIFEDVTSGYVEKPLSEIRQFYNIIPRENFPSASSFNFYFGITRDMEENPEKWIFGEILKKMRKWGWIK